MNSIIDPTVASLGAAAPLASASKPACIGLPLLGAVTARIERIVPKVVLEGREIAVAAPGAPTLFCVQAATIKGTSRPAHAVNRRILIALHRAPAELGEGRSKASTTVLTIGESLRG
jgi:hypothetical protein